MASFRVKDHHTKNVSERAYESRNAFRISVGLSENLGFTSSYVVYERGLS